jgi:hypothetical protein
MKSKIIHNIQEVPSGYFRIHWPQYQILMDIPGYDKDVMHCSGEAMIHNLNTIALPYSWMRHVKNEMGQRTRAYIEFINQKAINN